MAEPRRTRRVLAPFPQLEFQGALRPSQRDVVELARQKLASGTERRLHIAAPPGSGKTVLGLYIWAHVVRRPAVVLSSNAAIQAQWAARLDLFQDRARTPALIWDGGWPQPAGAHELAATKLGQLAGYLPRHVLPSFSMPGLCGWRPAPLLREHRAPSALFPCRVCSYLFLPPGNQKTCASVGRKVTRYVGWPFSTVIAFPPAPAPPRSPGARKSCPWPGTGR